MIDPLACIGRPPEHREWRWSGFTGYKPIIPDSATIEAFVTVDAGVFRATRIGARSWLMKGVHLGHDVEIGEDCELAPHVSVGGECELGDKVKVGQGAVFKPRIKVGDGAVIGCGAVVVKDVPAGETWVGNPARKLPEKVRWTGIDMTEAEIVGWEELAAKR